MQTKLDSVFLNEDENPGQPRSLLEPGRILQQIPVEVIGHERVPGS